MLFFAVLGVIITVVGVHMGDGLLALIGATCAVLNGINFVSYRKGNGK